jgi:hypothetical protein
LLGKLNQESNDAIKPYTAEDLKVALEKCEQGPCELMIDKSSPPYIQNLQNVRNLKTKLNVPSILAYAGSPDTAANSCSAIQINQPTFYSGW